MGRTAAGGCCMCQRGNPYRVVDPMGVPVSFGAPPVWGAPGRLGTAAAGGLRRVPGGPVIQGCSRYYGPAWPPGCAGRRAGATASAVRTPWHPCHSLRCSHCTSGTQWLNVKLSFPGSLVTKCKETAIPLLHSLIYCDAQIANGWDSSCIHSFQCPRRSCGLGRP